MDFDLASKHKKEVEQRRREAKRKLEQQRKDENLQAAMERDFRQREEERLQQAEAERQRAQREALLNDGVYYAARLRPYPSTRTDDKLELPASALQDLEKQGALDSGSLLTFSVSLPRGAAPAAAAPGEEAAVAAATHAGVAEFTAEEGTVGVPPRVALCLTKGAGLGSLAAVAQVEVRYARLPRSRKSRVAFQPRGQGFHVGGASAFRIDLEHVLQESLRGHTALSEGDWLPIRHEGVTYELVVKTLEPEPQLALLDTDLTVEVLPSEHTEAELRAEEERRLREEEAAREAEERERRRLEAARLKALALGPEPEPGPEVVQLLLRLPDGGRLSRRFARGDRLQRILDWVESEPSSRVRDGEFRVVQKWPGHCRELGAAEASETLSALKFARQEALFLQHLADEAMPDAAAATEAAPAAADGPSEGSLAAAAWAARAAAPPQLDGQGAGDWSAAEERAHQVLDARLGRVESPTAALLEGSLEEVKGSELVGVFERLVALGMSPEPAAVTAKKFGAQLRELGEMGFEDWLEAVALLERYNGRVLRVANLLSERAAEGAPAELPPAPAAAVASASAAAPAPASAPAATAPKATPLDKEVVAARFRELVAGGMAPNDAATRAIQLVREEVRGGGAQPAAQPPAAPAAAVSEAHADPSFEDKLPDLAAMGFTDADKNRALLRKYAGRVDRVVDALCSS